MNLANDHIGLRGIEAMGAYSCCVTRRLWMSAVVDG